MNEKDYASIYWKSIYPVLIVFTIMAIYSYITSDEPLLESFSAHPALVFAYYLIYLLIGLPLVALLHRSGHVTRTALILIGLLAGFIVIVLFDSFQFNIKKGWNLYLIFTSTGGLSGYYVYRLLKKRSK